MAAGTERVSVGPRGAQANQNSSEPDVSADGRYVAFALDATNLVPGDTNGWRDVFVHDRGTGRTTRVSIGPGGAQANAPSEGLDISADGRFVAFSSRATNLVPGDTNRETDVFVRDLRAGTTRRASVGRGGAQSDGFSSGPSLSADGRFVAFHSEATNLVSGDTNGQFDVFVRDLQAGSTRRVSLGPRGAQGNRFSLNPAISGDGRVVAFQSDAGNLVPGDTNDAWDVFVRLLATGTTRRVSVGPGGAQVADGTDSGVPDISADGRFVAFTSRSPDLVAGDENGDTDVFLHELRAGATRRPSVGAGGVDGNARSGDPVASGDRRLVAFRSDATNLAPRDTNGHTDVLVRDRRAAAVALASVGPGGVQGNGLSGSPAISADGRFVAFVSFATNLVPGDTNGWSDIFVRTR
jgi:Tol biopolymer transport system component